jgi:hypothetical protein
MALTLDGSPVVIGDAVFDVVFGAGTVRQVSDTRITVLFANQPARTYAGNGVSTVLQARTLYWADPMQSLPPPLKDAQHRTILANAVGELAKHIRNALLLGSK